MGTLGSLAKILRPVTLSTGWRFSRIHHVPSSQKTRGQLGCDLAICSSQANQSSYPLTKEEAFVFLERNLGISRAQINNGGTSLDFFNRLIKEMNRRTPFTNINLLTERPLSNLKPEDWKNHIMSGQGGTCRWNNPFMKALLERLGYITIQIPGNIPGRDKENETHISTLVCDVSYPGSRHLVECGTRWPLSEAIPLDFATESTEYLFYGLRCKFFKNDNILQLCIPSSSGAHDKGVLSDSNGAKWEMRIKYWLNKTTEWVKFNESFIKTHEIQNKPIQKPFDSFLFHAFLNDRRISIACSDGRIHALFYKEDHTQEKVVMTKTELLNWFLQHYPQYSIQKLEKVCEISKL